MTLRPLAALALLFTACGGGNTEPAPPDAPVGSCGNGTCDFPVDCTLCPAECGAEMCGPAVDCGNSMCDPTDCQACPDECGGNCPDAGYMLCDNGVCDLPGDCTHCPADCMPGLCMAGPPDGGPGMPDGGGGLPGCGNGVCDVPQDCVPCPGECAPGVCGPPTPIDGGAAPACGNGICEIPFDCTFCPDPDCNTDSGFIC